MSIRPIDPVGPPPFEQIRQGIVELVDSGQWPPGTRLPTVRSLASELDVATNTVARAYRELEAAGVTEGRGRHGTFVKADGPAGEREIRAAAHAYLRIAADLGMSDAEALTRLGKTIADRS